MTSSIPDGISFNDLQALAASAREEANKNEEASTEMTICDLSPEVFDQSVKSCIAKINNEFSHPMTAKLQALEALANLMCWHSDNGKNEFTEGNAESGIAWLRDAGKIQACMSTLVEVILPDDYIYQHEMGNQCRRFTEGE